MDAALAASVKPSSFRYSFSLLPRDKRLAIQRVYEFCRATDDLADTAAPSDKGKALADWRSEIERCYRGEATDPVVKNVELVVRDFCIPKEYLKSLVDGVEMDLSQSRYETFEELQAYCYRVASVVGLISMEIFGYKNESTKQYAVELGYALQLTNIIRDVAADARLGRIYLPLEDLRRFSYTEDDLMKGLYNDRFIALMKFEAERAKTFYERSTSLLAPEDRATMFPAEIMRTIYRRLLRIIEQEQFNLFDKTYTVGLPYKLASALRYWMQAKIAW